MATRSGKTIHPTHFSVNFIKAAQIGHNFRADESTFENARKTSNAADCEAVS
jgi:hypothetical protein